MTAPVIFGQRLHQRLAAVDVEVVGRLVEDHQVGPGEGRDAEKQPRLLAAGKILRRRVHLALRETHRAGAGAHLRLGRVRHQQADVIVGGEGGLQFVELVLGEIGDVEAVQPAQLAVHGAELAGEQLRQRRLAVAVRAEEPDAIVVIDAEIEAR